MAASRRAHGRRNVDRGSISCVDPGGAPISIQVAKWIVSYYQNKGKSNDPIASLSGRENEILELLAKGFSDKQMARHLMIAQSTVNDHLKSIYRRLGVHSRAEAVAKYLSRNFRAG